MKKVVIEVGADEEDAKAPAAVTDQNSLWDPARCVVS
jgi:hypothetical protein